MIKSLFDAGHSYVASQVADVLTILNTPELASDLAALYDLGLPRDFIQKLTELLNTHLATYGHRERSATRVSTEAKQADQLVEQVQNWARELGTCFAILDNRKDPARELLRLSLKIGEPLPTTHLAAQNYLRDVLASLAEDDGVARMPLGPTFIADGKAMYERLPKEHADVTRQTVIREKSTDDLIIQNDDITQRMEELALFNNLLLQRTGREMAGLQLALLRSRAAPRGSADEGGDAPTDSDGPNDTNDTENKEPGFG